MTPREEQIKLRIVLSVAAYGYEFENNSVMSDEEFDDKSRLIDTSIPTGNRKLDNFFKNKFIPDSGVWIHNHPDLAGIAYLYDHYYKSREEI